MKQLYHSKETHIVKDTRLQYVQGCVLSPLLYSLFTHDCKPVHDSNIIVKFADDTTVVGLISNNDETAYREEVLMNFYRCTIESILTTCISVWSLDSSRVCERGSDTWTEEGTVWRSPVQHLSHISHTCSYTG
ncbi:hypothetical protein AAFF_G00184740 [Aldrovandia affinis]|uniref:Reverse transcriptase domain-containing protein n=1 Tax=Aldrovandia affinis TaxID=143900 RepID=A0AAD7RKK5_9TELE|nr:hypothetical protein AAFF_G00184740 [Aldrovandia affinis]